MDSANPHRNKVWRPLLGRYRCSACASVTRAVQTRPGLWQLLVKDRRPGGRHTFRGIPRLWMLGISASGSLTHALVTATLDRPKALAVPGPRQIAVKMLRVLDTVRKSDAVKGQRSKRYGNRPSSAGSVR